MNHPADIAQDTIVQDTVAPAAEMVAAVQLGPVDKGRSGDIGPGGTEPEAADIPEDTVVHSAADTVDSAQ